LRVGYPHYKRFEFMR